MNLQNLCMGCMREKPVYGYACPYCGFEENTYQYEIYNEEQTIIESNRKTLYSGSGTQKELPQRPLPVWTTLNNTFLVGKKLGAGGFGISYVGFDINLERKVAIKEFYPRGYADRLEDGKTLRPRDGRRGQYFLEQREAFVHEGKILAQAEEQGVVRVISFFKENETAYIVMEFLEGQSLNDYIRNLGRRLYPEEAIELIRPVVKSLAKIHEAGVIHRDISPDNIMLTNDGGVKLIDFGAALGKGEHPEGPPIGKRAYAPIEQLTMGGKVGTYSDVYSLCAMIYFMITGARPPRSQDRQQIDNILTISQYGIHLRPVQEAAIMQGLVMDYNNRIKNASDLYYLLYIYGADPNASVEGLQKKVKESSTEVIIKKMQRENLRSKNQMRMFISLACILVAGLLIITVRTIGKIVNQNNSNNPVSIDGNSDGATEVKKLTKEELAVMRQDFYDLINEEKSEKGKKEVVINSDFEDAANEAVSVFAQASGKTDMNTLYVDTINDVTKAHKLSNVNWVVNVYSSSYSVEDIKEDLYANTEASAKKLKDCKEIGVAIATTEANEVYWLVFYK